MSCKLVAVLKQFKPVPEADLLEVNGVLNDPRTIYALHDFEKTPLDLDGVLEEMRKTPADLYKIAALANSSLDLLRMLELAQKNPDLIAISMGEMGQASRVLAPVFGGPLMYAPLSLEEANAPGQIPLSELLDIYRFRSLNPETRIYALLGDPVSQSIGHLFHNAYFRDHGLNAVYVKIRVKAAEIGEFLAKAKHLKFYGFSITRPLKEAILPFLDEIDPEARAMGAVNTVVVQEGKLYGYNTDAKAACDVLEEIAGKKITLLGKGGAAKAIGYEAVKRGAEVTFVYRSNPIQPYDILINCTPDPMPIEDVLPGTIVMDLSLKETTLLQVARAKGCKTISGHTMYTQQALEQLIHWR